MKIIRHSIAFFIIILVSFTNCKTSTQAIDISKFEHWNVNPNDSLTQSLTTLTNSVIDSFVTVIRHKSTPGAHTDTLQDSSGTDYVLGYKAPDSLNKDSLYPLIVYLHGGTGTEVNTKGDKAYEMLLPLSDSMKLFLASPSANRNARWWDANGLQRILQTVRFMTLHYPIDPNRIFLCGVSDGATGCWQAANTINGPFAGFFAISGFGGMLPTLGIELFPDNLKQRPIYSVNAGKDRLYPLQMVHQFIDIMLQNHVNVVRKEYPDEEHGFDYRNKEFGTLCNYIRTWKRPTPNNVSWVFSPGVPNISQSIIDWSISEAADLRYVNGFFSNDTLVVQTRGISTATFALPTKDKYIYVKANQGSINKINPVNDRKLFLQLLISSCNPEQKNLNLFKIKF